MSLRTPPALYCQIVVTAGINDQIYWWEAGPFDLSGTLTAGNYYPLALAQHVASVMTVESGVSGATNSYSASMDVSTGKVTITRSGGTATFYPKVTAAEIASILTGGGVDTAFTPLAIGDYGQNHLGWIIAASSPAAGTSFESDQAVFGSFIPDLTISQDSEETFERTVVEAIALDGSGDVYSFSPWEDSASEFPLYGGNWQRRRVQFQRQSQTTTTWFLSQFWGPAAGAGIPFQYYPDRSDSATYYTYRLTGDSLRAASRGVRLSGYALWTIELEMRRAP